MKTVWSKDRRVAKIYGDHSSQPVIATAEVVAELGGDEQAFHAVKKIERFLPGPMLEKHPLGMKELGYARQNQEKGEKYWQWRRMQGQVVKKCTGYDYVQGYGHPVDGGFAFVNSQGVTEYTVAERKTL